MGCFGDKILFRFPAYVFNLKRSVLRLIWLYLLCLYRVVGVGLGLFGPLVVSFVVLILYDFVVGDGLVANIGEVEGNLFLSPLNDVVVRLQARIFNFGYELGVVVQVDDVRDSRQE